MVNFEILNSVNNVVKLTKCGLRMTFLGNDINNYTQVIILMNRLILNIHCTALDKINRTSSFSLIPSIIHRYTQDLNSENPDYES